MKARYIYESLNEMNFERRKDPLGALGIGRRKMIEDWLDEMEIYNYIINDDLTIDIDDKHSDSVDLMHKGFKELPVFIQFGNVGSFYISHNELQTLRGCPTYVQRTFSCQDNKLSHCRSDGRCFRPAVGRTHGNSLGLCRSGR